MAYEWLTTAPSPYNKYGTGDYARGGQNGWRLHAVVATENETFSAVKDRAALCGLRPRYGWGLDFWIDEKCRRCLAKTQKLEA